MIEKLIKDIEEKINKSNEFVLYFDKKDIVTLVKIIKILEKENKDSRKYIKELENQHKQDCNIINIYIGGNE